MKTLIPFAVFCLLCGCGGGATPGQYKTKERPSAVAEPVEPGKEAPGKESKIADKDKATEKNSTTEKDKRPEIGKAPDKNPSSEKNKTADKK